ncbi:MAG TPA: RNA repair domain-containing protein [Candidatus Bathyarchaeia archaeon]|nr:RNA repair domain-containing protein [Candidatus Bathyarchaeia archaeon]
MVHPLKNILNRLRWDSRENPENYLITYRHRGAPGDIKQILASQILKLGKSYFTLSECSDETTIPFHRILEIRNLNDGSVIWRKRTVEQNSTKQFIF